MERGRVLSSSMIDVEVGVVPNSFVGFSAVTRDLEVVPLTRAWTDYAMP